LPPTPYHRRLASSPSAKGSWGSQRTGISESTFSAVRFILSPRARGGRVGRFALVALRSRCGTRARSCTRCALLTDKRRIPLRSTSVRTYTFFTTGFPRFLSIRGARGLQAFDLPLHTSYSNPNYD
jgi:hypothetical protein